MRMAHHRTALLWLIPSLLSPPLFALQQPSLSSVPPTLTVTLKMAVDRNGGVVDRSPDSVIERFTCDASLDMVHRLRSRSDAILVGRETVVRDNPSLLVRRGVPLRPNQQQPLRIVLDPHLRLVTSHYQLFQDGHRTLVYHRKDAVPIEDTTTTTTTTTTFVDLPLDGTALSIDALCHDLVTHRGVQHLMVEGGPATAHAFLRAQRVDRCLLVRATTVAFVDPLPSGLSDDTLADCLQFVGTIPSGVDAIDCWSKDGTWPTPDDVSAWP